MSHPRQNNSAGWSRRQLWRAIVFVFLAQIVLIFVLSERRLGADTNSTSRTFFRFLATPVTETEIFATVFASDPTLFVLPNQNGFSGMAWLKLKDAAYDPPQWSEPPRWLTLNTSWLGRTFVKHARASEIPAVFVEENPTETDTELPFLPRWQKPSSLRIEGDLRERFIESTVELRSWEHADVLGESVVQVAINGAGDVVTCRLLQPGCGLRAADDEALRIARTARFQPRNSGQSATSLSWGSLIYSWQTIPVAQTNSTTVTPGTP